MTTFYFAGQPYVAAAEESLLAALQRFDVPVPSGCRAGACQACIVQITSGAVPGKAQIGLTAEQKNAGCVLSCLVTPEADMQVQYTQLTAPISRALVVKKELLNNNIVRLFTTKPFDFAAGQYVRLAPVDGFGRCYSIASIAADDCLEFHIKILTDGEFSQWVLHQLQVGDELQVQGPMGNCFYQAKAADQPLFLAAIGTGAAAALGIVRAALAAGHTGPIHWLQGAKSEGGLYALPSLAKAVTAPNVNLHFVVLESGLHPDTYHAQDIYAYARQLVPDYKGYQVYLCGADSFVRKMKKQCFLAGANLKDIFADAFVASALTR